MKIILLGGVPGVGKTTISNYLAIKYFDSRTICKGYIRPAESICQALFE